MSLSDARTELTTCRELVKQGLDPILERKKSKQEQIDRTTVQEMVVKNSFEHVAMEWINQQSERWSANHSKAVERTFQNDTFPTLGKTHLLCDNYLGR